MINCSWHEVLFELLLGAECSFSVDSKLLRVGLISEKPPIAVRHSSFWIHQAWLVSLERLFFCFGFLRYWFLKSWIHSLFCIAGIGIKSSLSIAISFQKSKKSRFFCWVCLANCGFVIWMWCWFWWGENIIFWSVWFIFLLWYSWLEKNIVFF